MGFGRIKASLDRANQLAPLVKPALIKALLAAAGECAPIPLAVTAIYSGSGWPDAEFPE